MGEREILLVIGAMIFFAMTSLSVNRFCLDNNEVMMQSEFNYYAVSLAQGIIEEAKTRAFDVAVVSAPANDPPNDFTYPLGPRWNEYYPNFNDVDDYNGLTLNIQADVNGPPVNYTVHVVVGYVKETNPDKIVSEKTFYKKMIVTVSSDYISSDVVLSHVFGYYEY